MKITKRILSAILSLVMIVTCVQLPLFMTVSAAETTLSGTVYKKTSSLTAGSEVVIVASSSFSTTSNYVLADNGGSGTTLWTMACTTSGSTTTYTFRSSSKGIKLTAKSSGSGSSRKFTGTLSYDSTATGFTIGSTTSSDGSYALYYFERMNSSSRYFTFDMSGAVTYTGTSKPTSKNVKLYDKDGNPVTTLPASGSSMEVYICATTTLSGDSPSVSSLAVSESSFTKGTLKFKKNTSVISGSTVAVTSNAGATTEKFSINGDYLEMDSGCTAATWTVAVEK